MLNVIFLSVIFLIFMGPSCDPALKSDWFLILWLVLLSWLSLCWLSWRHYMIELLNLIGRYSNAVSFSWVSFPWFSWRHHVIQLWNVIGSFSTGHCFKLSLLVWFIWHWFRQKHLLTFFLDSQLEFTKQHTNFLRSSFDKWCLIARVIRTF